MVMTRAERTANLIGVVLPFLGLFAALVLLWNSWVDWIDLGILVGTYLLFGLGVTVGYHRMLTHRGFRTSKPLEYTFAVLGSMALQGSVMDWVADHRKHHAHTDQEGDPHSPHVGHGSGLAGLWHAHTGWLFETHGQADWKKYARDLYEDRGMRRIGKAFPYLALYSLVLPALLGFIFHGFTLEGALRGLVWGGLVRAFFLHHVTWSINSICHFFGSRRFAIEDHSTNVMWLALPSMGEAWHHNHHAFPRSAEHGLRGIERWMDPSAWVIRGLERVGLAWNVVRITPERQMAKVAGAAPAPRPSEPATPERETAGV
jgi:stearoyl-CoA desaturase (Delta-9 desaturase)